MADNRKKKIFARNFLLVAFLLVLILLSLGFVSAYSLKVTEEHPFLVDGKWVSASELKVGDGLTTIDGKKVVITNIRDVVSSSEFPVYNLESSVYHDFVVSGDVVVHNSNANVDKLSIDTPLTVAEFQGILEKRISNIRTQDLENVIRDTIRDIRSKKGDEKTMIDLMGMFYTDRQLYRYPQFFSPENVKSAFPDMPLSEVDKIIAIMNKINAELNGKYVFEENIAEIYQENVVNVLKKEGVTQSQFLDYITEVLAKGNTKDSFASYVQKSASSIIESDNKMHQFISSTGAENYHRVYLLRDAEIMWARDVAVNGPEKSSLALVSRESLLTEDEFSLMKKQKENQFAVDDEDSPVAVLTVSDAMTVDDGIVYKKILCLYPEAKSSVLDLKLEGTRAYSEFQNQFTKLLKNSLNRDPDFAKAANRVYDSLSLPNQDMLFIDTGEKGTIPTFLSAMHRIKTGRKTSVYLFGATNEYRGVVPSSFGVSSVRQIEYMRKLSEHVQYNSGCSSPTIQPTPSIDEIFANAGLKEVTTK